MCNHSLKHANFSIWNFFNLIRLYDKINLKYSKLIVKTFTFLIQFWSLDDEWRYIYSLKILCSFALFVVEFFFHFFLTLHYPLFFAIKSSFNIVLLLISSLSSYLTYSLRKFYKGCKTFFLILFLCGRIHYIYKKSPNYMVIIQKKIIEL